MKVLIIDDSPVSREHMSYFVREAGFDPILFESAEQLLEWSDLNGLTETLVLLDWVMPDVQGTELCKIIRSKYPHSNTYIIMASAKNESADVAEGLRAGADDYISKPFNPQEIHARLEVGVRTLELRADLDEANRKRFAAERYAGVGQLAAGAAHEINNPLGFLKSNLSLLQAQMPAVCTLLKRAMDPSESIGEVRSSVTRDDLAESLQDFSEMLVDMCNGAERIGAIVGSLQAFTSDIPQKNPAFNLNELLRSVVGGDVKLDYDSEVSVAADPQQLKRLICELIDNARWAVQEGGEIEISTGVVGDNVRLVVADTGCGIEPDNLLRVTDPFFTTKAIGSALGMGLSRAEAIVRNHGGQLHLTSAVGKGTRVVCELPLQ